MTAQAGERPQTGVVLAVGPGKVSEFPVIAYGGLLKIEIEKGITKDISPVAEFKRMPMVLQEGDRILFGKYSGAEIQIDRDKVVVMRETEVLALVEGEA